MEWLRHVAELKAGNEVQFRPKGHSMMPRIHSGELITISPDVSELKKGDIVFCKVKGHFYVHLVKAIRQDGILIGNNHGHINGWASIKQVYGKVVKVEP